LLAHFRHCGLKTAILEENWQENYLEHRKSKKSKKLLRPSNTQNKK
jgi:hypothetical protein